MRHLAMSCALLLGAIGAAQAQQARLPASYPHDMTQFECSHRDEGTCDNAPLPPPDYTPIVGTWVRYSLLRNGFSVQPPDAPLVIKFMNDGWWSMMEFPAGRARVDKPLAQQTPQELFNRFDKMGGGWGNYTNRGQVNIRHHKAGLGAGGGENDQVRGWHFDGNALVLDGTGPDHSPIIHARKLPNQPLGSRALVGSWERTAYTVEGAAANAVPEHVLLGEDGWFQATVLPPGRTQRRDAEQSNWTTLDYVNAYQGMEASWGTYNVENGIFLRRSIGHTDPNLEDKVAGGTYKLVGDSFTWSGQDAGGRRFEATYKRMAPFPIYAPMKVN